MLLLPILLLQDVDSLRSLLTDRRPTAAQLATLPDPSWDDCIAMYAYVGAPSVALRLPATLAMLALATLPRLRGLYTRHNQAVLLAFAFVQFVWAPVWTELRFIRLHGDMYWSSLAAMLAASVISLVIAAGAAAAAAPALRPADGARRAVCDGELDPGVAALGANPQRQDGPRPRRPGLARVGPHDP